MKKLTPGFYHVVIKGINEVAYFNGNAFAIVGCTKGYLSNHFDHIGTKVYFKETFVVTETGEIELAA